MFPLRHWITWMCSSRFPCPERVLSFHCRSHRRKAQSSESTGELAVHDLHGQVWDGVQALWIPYSPPPRTELHQNLTIQTVSSQMSGLQSGRKCISVAEALSLLFCYGCPIRLRQCILFCLLLSLSTVCSKSIHVVARVSFTPFCGCVIFHCEHGPHSAYPFSHPSHLSLSLPSSLSSRLSLCLIFCRRRDRAQHYRGDLQ